MVVDVNDVLAKWKLRGPLLSMFMSEFWDSELEIISKVT